MLFMCFCGCINFCCVEFWISIEFVCEECECMFCIKYILGYFYYFDRVNESFVWFLASEYNLYYMGDKMCCVCEGILNGEIWYGEIWFVNLIWFNVLCVMYLYVFVFFFRVRRVVSSMDV